MLILPLPAKPDWSRPPMVTLGLILLCSIVYFVFQARDDGRRAAAEQSYARSSLPGLELPAYLEDLEARGERLDAARLKREINSQPGAVLQAMEADADFMQRLRAGMVVSPTNPAYAHWQRDRARYEQLRATVFTERYSLKPRLPDATTLLAHMFLHADFMHLAGNMAVLFIVGYTVEAALGPALFLALFVLGGLAAAVPDLLLAAQRPGYSLGASGAISAVMAAYLVLFGRRRIRFFYWFIFFFNTARWPALVILPVWLGNELLQNFVFDPEGHVNYLAHFGGFIAGALMAGLYRLRRRGRTAHSVEQLDQREATDALRRSAVEHVARMRFDRAVPDYRRLVELSGDAGDMVEYLRVAQLHGAAEALADAAGLLVRRVAAGHRDIDGGVLAQALQVFGASQVRPPALSLKGSARVARVLIDAGRFDQAERLVLNLLARDRDGQVAAAVAERMANALERAGQGERAAALQGLKAQGLRASPD